MPREEHGIGGSSEHGLFAAHIYDRNDCGPVKFKEPVGITACLSCHDRYDLRTFKRPAVRVPPVREDLAQRLISVRARRDCIPLARRCSKTEHLRSWIIDRSRQRRSVVSGLHRHH